MKLLPSQGEVARSAETEGFRGHLCQGGKIAQALRRTLPSRFAIHLPLVREGASLSSIHTNLTYVEGYAAKGGGPDCGDGAVILESAVGLGSVSLTVNGR